MRKSTTYNRASIAAGEYNADGTLIDGEDGLTADPVKTSETFYVGRVGEEIADYTYNYTGDGTRVRTVSVFYYGAGRNRAADADTLDAMVASEGYRTDDITKINRDIADGIADNLLSETFYVGEKEEEISDYSYNYKLGDASIVKNTSIFFYGAGANRAADADTLDAMLKSESSGVP